MATLVLVSKVCLRASCIRRELPDRIQLFKPVVKLVPTRDAWGRSMRPHSQ